MHFTSSQLLAFIGLAVYAVAPVAGQYYDEDEPILSVREALAEYDLDLDDIAYLVARGRGSGDPPRYHAPQVKQLHAGFAQKVNSAMNTYKANFAANKGPPTDPTFHDMAGAPDPTAPMRSQVGQMHKQAFINNAGPINDAAQTVKTASVLTALLPFPQTKVPSAFIGAGAHAIGHLASNIVNQQKSAANAAQFQGLQDQINHLSQAPKPPPQRRSIGASEEEEAMLAMRDAWMEYDDELARRGIDAYDEEDYIWMY